MHARQRHTVSDSLGGIGDEVEAFFFGLDKSSLEAIFQSYNREYGSGAEDYARRTYAKWKSGNVTPSGETLSRLLDLVPPHMPLARRHQLIRKMRTKHMADLKRNSRKYVTTTLIDWESDLRKILQEELVLGREDALSPTMISTATWLNEGDAAASLRLIRAMEQYDLELVQKALPVELDRLRKLVENANAAGHRVSVEHEIDLPHCMIKLSIQPPKRSLLEKILDWIR
jgi:hypothetical protein